MKKHLVKFTFEGKQKQKTVMANDIYEAERLVRKQLDLSDKSRMLFVKTIKCGRHEYQVFGSTLYSEFDS